MLTHALPTPDDGSPEPGLLGFNQRAVAFIHAMYMCACVDD